MSTSKYRIQVQYYAMMREEAGTGQEEVETDAATVLDLFAELKSRHGFTALSEHLKVVVNEEFCEWSKPMADGDVVVFIPPVAGG